MAEAGGGRRGGSGSGDRTREGPSREPRAQPASRLSAAGPPLGFLDRAAPREEETMLIRRPAPPAPGLGRSPAARPPPRPAPPQTDSRPARAARAEPEVRLVSGCRPRCWACVFQLQRSPGGVADPNSRPLLECPGGQLRSPLTRGPEGQRRRWKRRVYPAPGFVQHA